VQSRRSVLSLLAATVAGTALVKEAHALSSIKIEPPPAPFGGLRECQCAKARPSKLVLLRLSAFFVLDFAQRSVTRAVLVRV
jgi:hypothetical protein